MRAAMFTGIGQIEIGEVPDPTPGPKDVVIEVASVGLCGTDLHILMGEYRNTQWPIIPGHEFAGTVVAVGSDVTTIAVGDRVAADPNVFCGSCYYCRIGHGNMCENFNAIGVTMPGAAAEYVVAPAGNCYVLPEQVDTPDAMLIEPFSCVVRAIDVVKPKYAAHVLIYGAGTMGLMMASAMRHAGAASVSIVEPNETRRARVAALDLGHAAESADQIMRPRGWEVVIDCAGVVAAIEDGLTRVGKGGTFLQFGVTARDAKAKFDPYKIFQDEITITGSMAVLHSYERAGDLFSAGALDPRAFITTSYPLADYAKAIEAFKAGDGLKVQVTPGR